MNKARLLFAVIVLVVMARALPARPDLARGACTR